VRRGRVSSTVFGNSYGTSKQAVDDLKVLIDQIREQVQNIE
jgi:uncharacterized protein YicC (UPF0701 family)